MDCVDYAAGVFEWAAATRAESTACPAGVDEPAVDLMSVHAFGKHFCVVARLNEVKSKTIDIYENIHE